MPEPGGVRPIAIGHRGAPTWRRENTLPSLMTAIDLGADWVELDVKVTADRVPIVLHDATLARLWHVQAPVSALTVADVQRATGGGTDRIPLLREAVLAIAERGSRVVVDIGTIAEAAASCAVTDDVADANLAFTGDPAGLAYVRARRPEAMVLLSWESSAAPPAHMLDRVRPQYLNQDQAFLTEAFVDHVRRGGMSLSVYTVDTPSAIDAALSYGADAIISNDIAVLRDHIDRTVTA